MKMFVPLALLVSSLASLVSAEVTLEDVYGPAARVENMAPIATGAVRDRAVRPASFLSHRSKEQCDFPLEILLVQDVTASFSDNFEAMVNTQLPQMFRTLGVTHPDTTYGVVTFRDKPIAPLGTPATDYCEQIGVDFTSNTTAITSFYDPLTRVGGGDPAENQFGALIASIQSKKITWGANAESTKLIVMVTDAPPHFEGDGHNTFGMKPATGDFSDASAEQDCLKYYYPSPDQVLSNIKGVEAYFAVLVYDPQYWNGLPAKAWQWFNRFIGQTDDFANLSANDQSDFWEKLSTVITYIENLECVDTTTTPPPTTTTTEDAVVTPVGSTQVPPATDECVQTIICEDDVLVKIGFPPESLDVVVDGKQIV